jgi:transcriptional regulator with XRE-family HTH domain
MDIALTANRVDSAIGAKLQQLRKDKNLSVADVAHQFGTDVGTADGWENGTIRISAAQLFKLSQILGVPIGVFFENVRAL